MTKPVDCDIAIDQAIENYSNRTFFASGLVGKSAKLMGFSAAAATGLLACNQVEADIQYSGLLNTSVSQGGALAVNIDSFGDNDVSLFNSGSVNQNARGFALRREGAGNFQFMGIGSSMVYRGGASQGDASSGAAFSGGATGWMGLATGGAVSTDPWGVFANEGVDQTGILGFQFNGQTASGGTGQMFGWMQLQLRYDDTSANGSPGAGDTLSMTLVDYAYEDMGNGIHFGDVGAVVPEPGSAAALALLALGAAGVRRRRKGLE